ncbi:MAG: DUF4386 family protein [Chitinophagales bacterium]|nr:DUF4386 family protein [Chitinophagales bacterium]
MKQVSNKTIGYLLIAGAVALFIPYTILTIIFEYPDILRQDTAAILIKFQEGGNTLIRTWFAFAITGLPLLPAYMFMGQKPENESPLIRPATGIGIIGLVVLMIGLLRWTFVVPVLAGTFVAGGDASTKSAAIIAHARIENAGETLLPGMFIEARINIDDNTSPSLPSEAIVSNGNDHFIFAEQEPFTYRQIPVRTGTTDQHFTEIIPLEEIAPRQKIVLKGAYYLLSELTKGEGEHNH